MGAQNSQGKGQFGGISQPSVKYKEYPAHGPYSQPYSVGGSSDAAFRCQYSSNVPLTDGYLKHYVFKHYYCTVSQKNKTVNARA